MKKSAQLFTLITTILAVLFGIYLRQYIWFHEAGFCGEEGALILNIQEYKFLQLFFVPLNYAQFAPPFFMTIGKFLYCIFGFDETVLRSIPVLSSVIGLILFPVIVQKMYNNRFATLIATVVLTFHMEILYYQQLFKQYSSDILCTELALLLALRLKISGFSKKTMIMLILPVFLLFFTSYTSIIVLSGIFAYFLFFKKENLFKKIRNFMFFLIPFCILLLPFLNTILSKIQEASLQDYWYNLVLFAPKNFEQFKSLIIYLMGNPFYNFILILLAIVYSIFSLFKNDKFLFSIIVFPVITAMISGLLRIYPFADSKETLYLTPIFILLYVYPFKMINFNKKLLSLALFVYAGFTLYVGWLPHYLTSVLKSDIVYKSSNAKSYYQHLRHEDVNEDDVFYLDNTCEGAFDAYDINKVFEKNQKIYEQNRDDVIQTLENKLPYDKNIFFYVTNDYYGKKNHGEEVYNRIKEICNIIYAKEEKDGIFIKCYRLK